MVSKDIFIEHEYSAHLNDVLDALLCEPRHGRMPCWLITGDAGMGKTAHLHRFARRYPDHRSDDNAALVRPIVIANVPPEPTRQTLEWCVLEALNAPTALGGRGIDRAGVIRRLLVAHETRVLILDEVQHLCHTRSRDRAVVLDAIKALSTTSQINVICAGTPAVEREFRADPQIERRFSVTRFTQWTAGPALQRFVGTYERARPLKLPSGLARPEMIRALLAETAGITHRIMQCLNSAAIVAIHEGIERITTDLIKVERSEPGRVLAARRSLIGQQHRESLSNNRAGSSQIEARP
jgi:DNA transposition AAA+ family ATPase